MKKDREKKKQFVIWSFILLVSVTFGLVFPSLVRFPQYFVPVLSGTGIFLFHGIKEARGE